MSDCSFDIPFSGTAAELVEKAQKSIVNNGGTVNGDIHTGNFSMPSPFGAIAGSYTITAQCATFVITEKPMFLACGLIQSTIEKYLSERAA